MAVYLTLGKGDKGKLQHIDNIPSGKTRLVCPFCSVALVAVKGKQKTHHFRHDGETCNESLNKTPQIPGWHHFHLGYSKKVIESLKAGYVPDSRWPDTYHTWIDATRDCKFSERHHWDFFILNDRARVFTPTAKVILGCMPLLEFSSWMRQKLQERLQNTRTSVEEGNKHQGWLEIEAHRQAVILGSTLYLFKFKLSDGTYIHKVGRTQRAPEERLEETQRDVESATGKSVLSASVLETAKVSGHVEQYVFHRYHTYLAHLGTHKEYLKLDNHILKQLQSEFAQLNKQAPLTKDEVRLLSGRWRYEGKRLAASKKGIERALQEGKAFGRPKGTTLSNEAFLSKHQDVVVALTNGGTLNEAAENTGKSRSTVKRVKAAMSRTH